LAPAPVEGAPDPPAVARERGCGPAAPPVTVAGRFRALIALGALFRARMLLGGARLGGF